MQVIITSKTHMSNATCVGALAVDGRFLRLLNDKGYNQPTDTDFEIKQVWDIEFLKRINMKTPHVEDVLVHSKQFKGYIKDEITMLQIVEHFKVPIWRGNPDGLFDNCLLWTNNGSGYISRDGQIPKHSVGFWISDQNLTKRIVFEKVRYSYPNINGWRSLPYVGFENAIDIIPAGTLIRVSLARWWDRGGETEERCSLQLSGWYDIEENSDEEYDLPF